MVEDICACNCTCTLILLVLELSVYLYMYFTSCWFSYEEISDTQFESVLNGENHSILNKSQTPPEQETEWDLLESLQYVHCGQFSRVAPPPTSIVNIKMQGIWVMLRKCCNHPYLIEFPLTTDGEPRIDEDLVTCCGKMLVLDRILPALLKDGHQV